VYSADENILGDNINIINNEEVGLEVNIEKCKYTVYLCAVVKVCDRITTYRQKIDPMNVRKSRAD
jgi:hypothetical protein